MATKTTTSKKLYLVWGLDNGKNLTVTLVDPKDEISSEDVAPVMQLAITNDIFRIGTAKVTTAKDAYVRSTETLDLNTEGV